MAGPVIEARGLVKRYGRTRGIEGVTFDVRPGEAFGFLGPNGAGKTTTMRVLLGFLRRDAGEARVLGLDAEQGRDEVHARVGYVPGDLGLADRMTARERLAFLGNLRGGADEGRIEALARRLDLDLDRPLRALSRGNKQKVALVQAFAHDPELLVLDEPTSGLDPLMQQEFNAMVREAKARGATVFLSSHILPEVEGLCDRVAVVREGRVVAVEDVAAFRARAARRVRARFAQPPPASAFEGIGGVSRVEVRGAELTCSVQGPPGALLAALAARDPLDVLVAEPTIEDLFLGHYGEGRHA